MKGLNNIVLEEGNKVTLLHPKKGDIIIVTGPEAAEIGTMISQLSTNMDLDYRAPIITLPDGLSGVSITTLKRLKADIEKFELQEELNEGTD